MFLDSTGTLQPPVSGYGLISTSEQSRICAYAMDIRIPTSFNA